MNKNIFLDNSNKNIRPVSNTIIKKSQKSPQKKISIKNKKTDSIHSRDRVASSVFYDYDFKSKTKSLSPSLTRKNINSKIENNEVINIVNKAIKDERKSLSYYKNGHFNNGNFKNGNFNNGNFYNQNLSVKNEKRNNFGNSLRNANLNDFNNGNFYNKNLSVKNEKRNNFGNNLRNANFYNTSSDLKNDFNISKNKNYNKNLALPNNPKNPKNLEQMKINKKKYIQMSKSVDNISLNSTIIDNVQAEITINNSLQNISKILKNPADKENINSLKNNLKSLRKLFYDIKTKKLKMQEIIDLQKKRLISLTFNPPVPSYIKNPDLLKDLHSDVITLMEAYDKLYFKYNGKKNGVIINQSLNETVKPQDLQRKLRFLRNGDVGDRDLNGNYLFEERNKNFGVEKIDFKGNEGNHGGYDFGKKENKVNFGGTLDLAKNDFTMGKKMNDKRFTFFAPGPNNGKEGNYETSQSVNYLKHLKNQNLMKNINLNDTLNSSHKNEIRMKTVNPSDLRLKPDNFENEKLKEQVKKLKKNNIEIMNKLNSIYEKNSQISLSKKKYELMKKELINVKKNKDRYLNDNLKLNSEYGEVLQKLEITTNNCEELKLAYKVLVNKIKKKKGDKNKEVYEIEFDSILEEIPEFLKFPEKSEMEKTNLNRRISSERKSNVEITTNLFQLSDYKNKYKKLLGEYNSLKKKEGLNVEKNGKEENLTNSKLEVYYKKMVEDLQKEKKVLYEKVLKCQKKNKTLLDKIKGGVEDNTDFVKDLIEVIGENKNILKIDHLENGKNVLANKNLNLLILDKTILEEKKKELEDDSNNPEKVKEFFDFFEVQQNNLKNVEKKLEIQKKKINKKLRHFSFAIKNDVFLFKGEKNEKIEKFEEDIKELMSNEEMSENEKKEILMKEAETKKNLNLMNSDFQLDTPLNSNMDIENFNNSKVYNEKILKQNSSKFFLNENSEKASVSKNEVSEKNFTTEKSENKINSENKIKKKSEKRIQRFNTEIINKKNEEIDLIINDLNTKIKTNNINGVLNEKMIDMFIEKLEILRKENKETWERVKNSEKEIFELEKKNDELFRSNYLLTVILENRNTVVNVAEKQNIILIDFIKKLKNKKLGREELKEIFLKKIDEPCEYLKNARDSYLEVFEKIKKQFQI